LSVLQLTTSEYNFDIFYLSTIVLSVFQLTASEYNFDIFKLFL